VVILFFILKKKFGPVNGNFNIHTDEQPFVDPVSQDTKHKWKQKMVQKAKDLEVLEEEFRDDS
jgi:hypothetical protein